MQPEPYGPRRLQAVVLVERPRCTARCLATCAAAALAAGHEGSGLALPASAGARCHFHDELLAADRYRPLRSAVMTLLALVRGARTWGGAYVARMRLRAGSVRDAVTPSFRTSSGVRTGTQKDAASPPCTLRCLMHCARTGLSAPLAGSGLGLAGEGRCRLHQELLESRHGTARRAVARMLARARALRAAATRMAVRWRGAIAGARRFRAGVGRHEVLSPRPHEAPKAVLTPAVTAKAHAWLSILRHRSRMLAERQIRRGMAGITEFVIWAVPRPKPPIRSVAHVSLISHKQFMLSRLARNHGLKGTFVAINTYPNAHLHIGFDYEVPMNMDPFLRYLRASWYLWRVLAFHDVIHYHFNGFLFDDGTDLRVLQRMGKVIVVHYRGCDVRCRSINMTKNPQLNVCQECSYPVGSCDTDYQRGKITVSRSHSDIRFVTTPDLLDFADDAEHLPFIPPYTVDFSKIEPAPRSPDVFRVVTSSNHPALDGVRFVREAVDRMAAEGVKIELVEVFRQPFHEALALYKSADLYCGKLRMGYYNNANIESLMLGVPNMCYIRDQYLNLIPDSPFIVARPDNVYEKLREWVAKPGELKQLGARGPEFVRRYHHADRLMAHMIARYNQALQRKVSARCESALQSSVLH
jgi:hypothetical protein